MFDEGIGSFCQLRFYALNFFSKKSRRRRTIEIIFQGKGAAMNSQLTRLFLGCALSFLFSAHAWATGSCYWQGASVKEGSWLECKSCYWQYCQCQPDGRWAYCSNTPPSQGSCDWSNPDWTDPACSEGGSKPCDWTQPDWQNPECSQNPPPGGGNACSSCHANGVPPGSPPSTLHPWLPR